MSNGFDFDDDDQQNQNEPDWLKNLRKEHRDFKKANKDLTEELGKIRTAQRGTSVKSLLEAAGVNPKVAGFVPADVEATEAGIAKWLEEYGDVFGATARTSEPQTPEPQAQQTATSTTLDSEALALLARFQGSDAGATAVNADAQTAASVQLAQLAGDAKNSSEFFAALQGLKI